jgi:hypothetical protein
VLDGHSFVAHLSELLGRSLEGKVPILPAQTAILLARPIPRVFIKW